ncbi:hypothetical protein WJX81_004126 [Elliptochloris bilobata]|uniref:Uncharacterized protein n=1 Tax=Elliptochloris bilobata TaxID=381761 RepID=A0AAW1SHH0_9CHLO
MKEVGRYQALLEAAATDDQGSVPLAEHQRALADVRRLERQRAELQGVLRRALRLADVLRRQVAHVQASRVLPLQQAHLAGLL